ncbi:MAG TPA: zinc ribbon domain-containing protein [Candidatus Bathyarchaeia archaeon]|nr:zinc ribbon domain-containing protein [Candidatus Bathyarchaeia archaeon]
MPYCPKCGNKVEEGMAFCPRCGASLKMETAYQAAPTPSPPPAPPMRQEKAEKGEKNEKQEKQQPEKGEKHDTSQFGFLGFLVGGLILILIGAVAYINATTSWLRGGLASSVILLLIGVVIIIVGVYVATMARRHMPSPGPPA